MTTLLIGKDISPQPTDHRRWSLEIFSMNSEGRQSRVLEAFARLGMPGVHVLGEVRATEWLVIADSATIADEVRSRRVVLRIDPAAVRTVSINPRHHAATDTELADQQAMSQ